MINVYDVREDLEREYDWSYVENEGPDDCRFDWAGRSFYVCSNGNVEGPKGSIPKSKDVRNVFKKYNLNVVEY